MVKKENLFQLIRSLSGPEKRYFKLWVQAGKKETNYVQLFDAIDAQDHYDEKQVKQRFRGYGFTRQLHVAKIYLADLVLRSLRNYHTGNSVYAQVLDLLRDAEILFNKELYPLCALRVHKAEQLCRKFEKEALLQEALSWKRRLIIAQKGYNRTGINAVLEEEQAAIMRASDANYYWRQAFNLFDVAGDKQYLKKLDVKRATSVQSKTLWFHIRYSWYFMNGNTRQAEKEVSDLIEYLEANKDKLAEDINPYIAALGNKVGLLLSGRRWAEALELVARMRSISATLRPRGDSRYTVRLWLRLYNLELEIYRDARYFREGIALIGEVKTFLKTHSSTIPADYRIMLLYQFAGIYFNAGDLTNALKEVNGIINTNFDDVRTDLQCYARIMNLVLQFELDNIIVLRYAIDNCRRFLKNSKMLGTFEAETLKLFSALAKAVPSGHQAILAVFYRKHFTGNAQIPMLDYIDLKTWINSKQPGS